MKKKIKFSKIKEKLLSKHSRFPADPRLNLWNKYLVDL
jgi:hypothetical protein